MAAGRWIVVSLLSLMGLGSAPAGAQCPTPVCDPALLLPRSLSAPRLAGPPPVIDGRLDDPAWATAAVAAGFVENRPRPAAPAGLRSEARVLIDGEALYVAMRFFDPEPRRILAPLARRDDETISDWAFVEIDSRHDRRSGFSFGVNPRGVQVDGLWQNDIAYDASWNAVWEAAAAVDGEGWTAEFRIPFSQLAFNVPADGSEMVWGINFYRNNPARGESSNWSPRYPGLGGIVSHFNDLHLPAPAGVRRFEVTPYVAPRVGDAGAGEERVRAGADLKVGLGASFTLTATVLPDFGQVEADPSQLNLRAFELFQAERRPFFLEGLDVFRFDASLPFATRGISFAEESPFYSRRIGRAPRGTLPPGAELARGRELPTTTDLLAAAKLSGQAAHGWTLGMFTALTDDERVRLAEPREGTADWPVAARQAVTVARAIKSLAGGDASFGLFAANLHRLGLGSVLAAQEVRDAAVLGGDLRRRFGGRRYELRGWLLGSRLAGDEAALARVAESPHHYFQRPDGRDLPRPPYGTLTGGAGEVHLSRVEGALLWDLAGRAVSPGFDIDEIGFQRHSDWLLVAASWSYQWFRPGRAVRAWTVGSSQLGSGWTFAGEPRARVVDGYVALYTRNEWHWKVSATREMSGLSTDWLHGGPALLLPPRTTAALSVATDQRRASFATLDADWSRERASGSSAWHVTPLWNLRASDELQGSVAAAYGVDTVGWQFVGRVAEGAGQPVDIVGRVRQRTLSLTFRADWTFTPRLALSAYLQPFATTGRYAAFQRLAAPRADNPARRFAPLAAAAAPGASELGLDLDGDGAFEARLPAPGGESRALNANLILRWEYRPGSFLTVAWNQQREGLARASRAPDDPLASLGALGGDPRSSVLLLKLSRRLGR